MKCLDCLNWSLVCRWEQCSHAKYQNKCSETLGARSQSCSAWTLVLLDCREKVIQLWINPTAGSDDHYFGNATLDFFFPFWFDWFPQFLIGLVYTHLFPTSQRGRRLSHASSKEEEASRLDLFKLLLMINRGQSICPFFPESTANFAHLATDGCDVIRIWSHDLRTMGSFRRFLSCHSGAHVVWIFDLTNKKRKISLFTYTIISLFI